MTARIVAWLRDWWDRQDAAWADALNRPEDES